MFCLGCFPQPMLLPELVTEHQMPPCRCLFSGSAWLSPCHLTCATPGPTRLLLCLLREVSAPGCSEASGRSQGVVAGCSLKGQFLKMLCSDTMCVFRITAEGPGPPFK